MYYKIVIFVIRIKKCIMMVFTNFLFLATLCAISLLSFYFLFILFLYLYLLYYIEEDSVKSKHLLPLNFLYLLSLSLFILINF